MKEETVYIKAKSTTVVMNRKVFVEDVVQLYGRNKKLVKELNQLVLYVVEQEKKQKFCFSILKIIELLEKDHKDISIQNIGDVDFILEYIPPGKSKKILEWIKVIFVCFSVFIGAAFTIMTFNEDVGVANVFRHFYELIVGETQQSGSVLEISYSIGLPLGIILFFNHFSRAKIDSDPTPLQVRQRLYEEDMNKAIIENASRENKVIDAN